MNQVGWAECNEAQHLNPSGQTRLIKLMAQIKLTASKHQDHKSQI